MPAFILYTELFNFFRRKAREFGCNPCLDRSIKKIELMNVKGTPGKPACLCKVDTSCPCEDVIRELEADGVCYCGIFEKV